MHLSPFNLGDIDIIEPIYSFILYSIQQNFTVNDSELIFYMQCPIVIFKIIYVGPKDLSTPAHLISSPRPTPRRKKCPRMNKEGPSCQETLPRTILFLANQGHRRRKRHTHKDSLPGRPKQKGLTQWASHRSMAEVQFQEKLSPSH